jgi:uncharacterized damage-inducible protein DinB
MKPITYRLVVPKGRHIPEIALFLGQLDDLSRMMLRDVRGISPAELAWQSRPGHNTIGMLLSHIAVVEVHWTLIAIESWSPAEVGRRLKFGIDDDGMPLKRRGAPPTHLRGKTLAFYTALLRRARNIVKREFARHRPADLARVVTRTRNNGQVVHQDARWILYHLVEHLAGHYGQILLLRHLYADRKRK